MVKWSEEWQLRLTEGKCKVIHLPVGTNNPIYIYIYIIRLKSTVIVTP